MARVSLGPGSALIIGLSIVVGTGNGDRLIQAVHYTSGRLMAARALDAPDANGDGILASDLMAYINSAMERSLKEMRELVIAETRASQHTQLQHHSDSWAILCIKLLLGAGAIIGICHICDLDLPSVMSVGWKSVRATITGLQKAVTLLAAGCGEGLETLKAMLQKYRGNAAEMKHHTGQQLDDMDNEILNVKRQIAEVAESISHMNAVSAKANMGLQLMCHVLAENLPQSHAQAALNTFAARQIGVEENAASASKLLSYQPLDTEASDVIPCTLVDNHVVDKLGYTQPLP